MRDDLILMDYFEDDFEAVEYSALCSEISDGYTGETGDLVRDHAHAVLTIRALRQRFAEIAKLANA